MQENTYFPECATEHAEQNFPKEEETLLRAKMFEAE